MLAELRESIRHNRFSLALWDGATDAHADYLAELAVLEAEERENDNEIRDLAPRLSHIFDLTERRFSRVFGIPSTEKNEPRNEQPTVVRNKCVILNPDNACRGTHPRRVDLLKRCRREAPGCCPCIREREERSRAL